MRPEFRRGLLGLALLAVAGLPLSGHSASDGDPEQTSAELKALRERIKTIEHKLDRARREESQLSQSLRDVESRLSDTTRELEDTEKKLDEQQARLTQLHQDKERLKEKLGRHRDSLSRYLRTAFMLGRQESIKLVLNQEDPQRLGRTLAYYHYLGKARADAIEQARTALAELAGVETAIQAQVSALDATRERHRRQQRALGAQRAERTEVLGQLRRQIKDDKGRLSEMEQDEARLQQLLEDLRRALADVQHLDVRQKPFKDLRNQLPWPVAGKLTNRFGERREVGGMRWRGVFIAANSEQQVRSVSRGRVAFADWLRGFGLLIIIDHGDGYMSLYGHNQALYKEVGDWVEDGEVVATVGDTGGVLDTGLYFELRHDGQPIDPLKWCAGRPKALRAAR